MERNRQRDLQKNIVVGLLVQVLSLAVNLISKSAIRSYLDIEYLGLQSVFAILLRYLCVWFCRPWYSDAV